MSTVPQRLYTAAASRELDRLAIGQMDLDGYGLMERAADAALLCLRRHWPRARRILVVCGSGNNGGDGYVLARLAKAAGLDPRLVALEQARSTDARRAARDAELAGLVIESFDPDELSAADLVVDALFGTGLERDLAGAWRTAVEAINASDRPVLSVDIPSGLHSDSGSVLGVAVRADVTLTLIGAKRGLFTGSAPDHTGIIELDELAVPLAIFDQMPVDTLLVDRQRAVQLCPPRSAASHKGHFGHVLVLGGNTGMAGAPRLTGEAALRCGAGLVSLATRAGHAGAIAAACPALMVHPVEDEAGLKQLVSRAGVLALGPGLGRDDWGSRLCSTVFESTLPKVVDADGLHHIASAGLRRDDWVLTPHPGEAAMLLSVSTGEVQADRFGAAREIVSRYGGACVLKGAGTVIVSGTNPVRLCDRGGPQLATAGSGDVLTGCVAALLARGLPAAAAAELAVWVHAVAGEALTPGEIATDLARRVGVVLGSL